MPTPRFGLGVALEDNLLITAGGMCAGAVSTVEVLNTEPKQWYSLKSLQLPEPIHSCGMTISSGYVNIGGGGCCTEVKQELLEVTVECSTTVSTEQR